MDQTTVDVVTNVIGTLGFPIFVAVWMLMKGSKETTEMRNAINELTTAIKILTEKTDK